MCPARCFSLALALILSTACAERGALQEIPPEQDILSTAISLDLSTLEGEATLRIAPGADSVGLVVVGLELSEARVNGESVRWAETDGLVTLPVEDASAPVTVELRYTFTERTIGTFDGWMPGLGVSFLWPSNCGNLFPCNPATADGVTFEMEISGVDPSLTAVYPESTVSDAPPYMPGLAVGDYERLEIGTSPAGTQLLAWYLPEDREAALRGTAHLLDAWDFFETTYGPYAFGDVAGSVEVDWGPDSWGGMEHHPYFHVAKFDFGNEEPQVHEAAHGWFGDAVRIACWEDFVLSEGTVTYITARSLEARDGPNLWPMYVDDYLVPICEGQEVNAKVLPESCNAIDFEESALWSLAPYMKGACFYEEVADLIGAELLDEAIGEFYAANMNKAAHMQEMIDLIEAKADPGDRAAIEEYVGEWLLSYDCPEDYARRCRAHQP